VPASETYSRTRSPLRSTSIVVVPPPAAASYTNPSIRGTGNASLPLTSWLEISTVPPCRRGKLAAPSGSEGVGSPLSSTVAPLWATTV
jgi:hypothetical protein